MSTHPQPAPAPRAFPEQHRSERGLGFYPRPASSPPSHRCTAARTWPPPTRSSTCPTSSETATGGSASTTQPPATRSATPGYTATTPTPNGATSTCPNSKRSTSKAASPAPTPAACGYSPASSSNATCTGHPALSRRPTPRPARPTLTPQSRPAGHRTSGAALRLLRTSVASETSRTSASLSTRELGCECALPSAAPFPYAESQ